MSYGEGSVVAAVAQGWCLRRVVGRLGRPRGIQVPECGLGGCRVRLVSWRCGG